MNLLNLQMKQNYRFIVLSVILLFMLSGYTCLDDNDDNNINVSNSTNYENKFLKYIFNKYGSKGIITFEGLEHLMHNLGLGGIEFGPTHTLHAHRPQGFKDGNYLDEILSLNKSLIHDDDDDDDDDEGSLFNQQEVSISIESNETKLENSNYHLETVLNRSNESPPPQNAQHSDLLTDEAMFKEMHDPKHRHRRHQFHYSNACLSPKSLVHLVIEESAIEEENHPHDHESHETNHRDSYRTKRHAVHHLKEDLKLEVSRVKITPTIFMEMCPALLAQLDMRACSEYIEEPINDYDEKISTIHAWIYASLCVFVISISGLVGVAMVPLAKSVAYDDILKFLVALAVGTLCGDALMHLLPHALTPHSHGAVEETSEQHEHSTEPIWICFCTFCAGLFMFALETILPFIKGGSDGHGHSHHSHSHSHGHSHSQVHPQNNTQIQEIEIELERHSKSKSKENNMMIDEQKIDKKTPALAPIAFMVVLGDGLHNITDGLAIGAAFAVDPVTGMATSLAILCHELPHELGDFALLLQTGVSIRRAMFLNIVSSILSFMGMIVGLILAGMHGEIVKWIYSATSGTFLYIALADLVPEMRNSKTAKGILANLLGVFLGGLIMLLIALYEDKLRILFE